MFIHWGNKIRIPPNAVRVGMPPRLSSWSFRYLRVSSCMAGLRRCPVSSARSVQNKFGRKKKKKKKKNMKSENGVTATMTLFPHANSRLHLGTLSHLAS